MRITLCDGMHLLGLCRHLERPQWWTASLFLNLICDTATCEGRVLFASCCKLPLMTTNLNYMSNIKCRGPMNHDFHHLVSITTIVPIVQTTGHMGLF